jgi:hypothetical protein
MSGQQIIDHLALAGLKVREAETLLENGVNVLNHSDI